ncbi:MAG: carbon-nitrogen hydrolase family protein [Sedimentibacter sp.]|uniref:carbon-nitrogen hydrolase family protein n=1 Tax=Sedimentibacter sp. TaxID=1960295 RepID=UPI0031580EA2
MAKFMAALLQTSVYDNKEKNVKNAVGLIEKVAAEGADIAVFPEMFCCPYDNSFFRKFAEEEGGFIYTEMKNAAKKFGIYVVAGTMPELFEGRVYNTAYVFDREGRQNARHRKMHLFDIDVKGGQYFKESDTFTPGKDVTVFDTQFCRMGIAVCYDIRFPELSRLMAKDGAEVIIVPGAFNMTTGPAHWELHFRARALDNQVYAIGVAPARDMEASYHSYGNSIVASPWGSVACRLDEKEGYILQEIDLDYVKKIRTELPLLQHVRDDVYQLKKI